MSPNGFKRASRDPPRRMHINGRFMRIYRWVHFEVQSVAKLIQMGPLWADFGIILGDWVARLRIFSLAVFASSCKCGLGRLWGPIWESLVPISGLFLGMRLPDCVFTATTFSRLAVNEAGGWRLVAGGWKLATAADGWRLAAGRRRLAVGGYGLRLVAASRWPVAGGCWLVAGGWRQGTEIWNQRRT